MTFSSLSKIACLGGLLALALPTSQADASCARDPFIGAVCMTGAHKCPSGYFKAIGQDLSIQQYPQLFRVIGSRFGGDGKTYFTLPRLQGRVPTHEPESSVGNPAGRETFQMTEAQMPKHTHSYDDNLHAEIANDNVQIDVKASFANGSDHVLDSSSVLASGRTAPGQEMDVGAYSLSTAAGAPLPLTVSTTTRTYTSTGQVHIAHAGASQPIELRAPRTTVTYCVAHAGIPLP